MSNSEPEITRDPEVEVLRLNKESAYEYKRRRQMDWRENYTLYRDKVQVNRLTQRQSVNLPIMKRTIRTILKDIDDMPVLQFENLDNDKQREVFLNEYWSWTMKQNKMVLKDIVDKRQELLFGRTFVQMQVMDGFVKFTVVDPEDILVDRFIDPTDIDSGRSLIHTHIFRTLNELMADDKYDKAALADMKRWASSTIGILKSQTNAEALAEKNQKMRDMGLDDVDDPVLGETVIELSMHFVYDKRSDEDDEELFLKVEAEDMRVIFNQPLQDVIGETEDEYWKTHFPYTTWADDIENQDFWSDGVADIARTPNKVMNTWYSQLVENRTLRNFGMNYYDASDSDFNPQTFNPVPWGWYPMPGNPNELIKKVDIPDLSESLDEMSYVDGMIEKATGATATQQGTQIDRQVTLGEVELALGEAKERIRGISKFYTQAWMERGEKFLKLIEAASDELEAVKIFKKGRNSDDLYSREIAPKDWMSESGYRTRVWSQDEKNSKDLQAIQKLNAVQASMPDNPKLVEIKQRKLLEFADLSPDEVNDVMQFEKDKRDTGFSIDPMTGQTINPVRAPQTPLTIGGGQPEDVVE